MNTGLNVELLGKLMAIKHLDLLRVVVRPVKLAPSISYTIKPKEEKK